jgi:hypothetical protein
MVPTIFFEHSSSTISTRPVNRCSESVDFSQYSSAVSDLHDGTNQIYTETQTLPDNIGKIIDGKNCLKNKLSPGFTRNLQSLHIFFIILCDNHNCLLKQHRKFLAKAVTASF